MTWSKERPQKPGWYWWRECAGEYEEVCELVLIPMARLWVHWNASEEGDYLDDLEGEWAGPLEVPHE